MTSLDIRARLERTLGERYRMDRELGRGGMAVVYLAHDVRHDRPVALKVMHPDVALALGRERFLREIRFAARLSHPHILGVHDSGEADGLLYYVMPYVEGESLRERLAREGPLPVDDAIHIAREVADALACAHASGVVHRDIKPENILLSRGHAVVADFGIASAVDDAGDDRLTATGVSLGTPAYMSPEQALGENIDARADVWALGAVLYEMLTGEPPFGSDRRQVISRILTTSPKPLIESRSDVPLSVQGVIDRSLSRAVDDRLASGTEVVRALAAVASGSSFIPSTHPRNRRRRMAAAALAAIVLLVAAGAFLRARGTVASSLSPSKVAAGKSSGARSSSDSVANQLYQRGRAQLARRTQASVNDAINLFSAAIRRDSSFAAAWAGLSGAAQFALGRGIAVPGKNEDSLLAIAVSASERAVDLDSTNADIWLQRARAAFAVDPTDRHATLSMIRHALSLDSLNPDAWFALGITQEEMLQPDLAKKAWLRSVAVNPRFAPTLAFLGLWHIWSGEYAEGVRWADSAIAVDPTYVLGREAAGQLALELGRIDDAERNFRAYLNLTSGREQVNAYVFLTLIALARGDSATAQRDAEHAAALADARHPTKHEAPFVGMAMAAIGDTARAIRWISAYQPRGDLHFQLHLKRDPELRWLHGPRGKGLLTPDPK